MSVPSGAFMGHAAMHAAGSALQGPLNAIKIVSNLGAPLEYPSANEIIALHTKGYITNDQLKQGLQRVGVALDITGQTYNQTAISHELWVAQWTDRQKRPEGADLFEVANRQFWTETILDSRLANLGYYDPTTRAQVANLRYDIPAPPDLVRFSVRHIWEPELLAALGYDQEFPGGILDVWHAMKGLDYKLFSGPFSAQVDGATAEEGGAGGAVEKYAEAGIEEPTWAKAYWWSHWVLPSPGMGYEMFARLRPGRDRKYDPPEAEGLEFGYEDLALLLRANDYPPKYRPLLSAIAHRIPGIRFIRDFRKQGVYDFRAVVEWALRWNYSEQDALDIAADIEASVTGAEAKKTSCKGCATCDQAFEVGILGEDDLAACYTGFGLAQKKLQVKRARELVANVRKRFLKGTLSANDVQQFLQGAGIVQQRIDWYLADWNMEFEAGRKELSAQQAIKYACRGIISEQDMQNRLTNLGYPADDVVAMVMEKRACAQTIIDQANAKAARMDRQQKADAYTAARRARQSLVEAQRYLSSHGTPKQLHDWFCSGTISEPDVWTRLSALGWPDVDITRFLGDCKSGRKPAPRPVGSTPDVPPLVNPTAEATRVEQLP
jgi:hypothetical protein